MSQYNGKLHCDTAGFRCKVGWKLYCNLRLLGFGVLQHGAVGLQGECVTIHQVYCDSSRGLARGKLCHNTRNCIVTSGLMAGKLGHNTPSVL